MPKNLPNGYVAPSQNDQGSLLYETLDNLFERLAEHDHTDTRGASIVSTSITKVSSSVSVSESQRGSDGYFRVSVDIPSGLDVSLNSPKFYVQDILVSLEYSISGTSIIIVLNEPVNLKVIWG